MKKKNNKKIITIIIIIIIIIPINIAHRLHLNLKKQSRYRPGMGQRVPGS
jgi:hypothetical protein